VEYFDATEVGKINVSLEPFQKAIENTWIGEFYPNMILQGNPYVIGGTNSSNPLPSIDFNWGTGEPFHSN
jgi:hypothetical protein